MVTKLDLRVVFHHFMTNTVTIFINEVWHLKADYTVGPNQATFYNAFKFYYVAKKFL